MDAKIGKNERLDGTALSESAEERRFVLDPSQLEVVDAQSGFHLVLAPPGCGKTQILTERIRRAHSLGVDYADMLCLTFTNRAARGMMERIRGQIADEGVDEVFVGNVHRFCSKYLFEHGLIPAEASIIDEEDTISILANILNEDEYEVAAAPRRHRAYMEVMQLSHFMYQLVHGHPRSLRLHPECLTPDDVEAMRAICRHQHLELTAQTVEDLYSNADFYLDEARSEAYDIGEQQIVNHLLVKMRTAKQFDVYRTENKLVDFEDLLLLTYEHLRHAQEADKKVFQWVQVDEVQDLNALQLAIIDALTASGNPTVVYLGDEQQAIFSFMGAKMSTLEVLKERCKGHLHRLQMNHRSPRYLLDVFNCYAQEVLQIDPALLPTTDYEPVRLGNELQLVQSENIEAECLDAAQIAGQMMQDYPDETTAVVVSSNRDADAISQALKFRMVNHFKVSGEDLFSSPVVKLLFAHLNLVLCEHNFISWARVLKGLHVFETNTAARNFVRTLLNHAMLPSDFLLFPDSSYVQKFVEAYDNREIVVFDTETTGLDVFEDDIVQIAAVKMRGGQVVEGSRLSLFIQTARPIPKMLGDIENPILEELRHHELLSPQEALQQFLDYVGDAVLLAHNAEYDYHILTYNLQRYLPAVDLSRLHPLYFDSLKLARLLVPGLKEYKLKYLLAILHLEGENSHLADADVEATVNVVNYCYKQALEVVEGQRKLMQQKRVVSRVEVLRRVYGPVYAHTQARLYTQEVQGEHPALVDELLYIYGVLKRDKIIEPVRSLDYIVRYLSHDLIDRESGAALVEQLARHLTTMNTLKEADLCSSESIEDRIFVTTVHKAKGLEFDNVIIFDAVEDRYPSYFSRNNPQQMAEDARKFYVAMTRAKKRVIVMQSVSRLDYHGVPQPRRLTRFMTPLLKYFDLNASPMPLLP
uniref:DNA 3'-5' helicase n=1 Tax=Prevotella sp. GTC17259 TaxID=3236795 RepID=A0AB33J419_9BACT